MTDLVQRLRCWSVRLHVTPQELVIQAATRIEQLERENAELQTLLKTAIEQHEIVGRLLSEQALQKLKEQT